MRILAVDTSSNVASAAIVDGNKLVCESILNNKLTHSQTLMPIIDEVFKKSEFKPNDIDVFAVADGPGSFTGLRIGVTTVKGLAHATNKPICGVNTLEALAYNLPFCPYIISPIMDARREQVYNAFYKWENTTLKELISPRAISLEECLIELKEIGERVVFLGDGVPVFRDRISNVLAEQALFAPQHACAPRASCVAECAKNKKTMNYYELAPVYLRKSQAEREAEEKEAK